MKHLALLGGSFDPIHNGHLHIAREILRLKAADAVIFLPNATHNFKRDKVLLDYKSRHELIAKVLEPGMEVWDDDAEGSGYTADLIRKLSSKHPQSSFLWVIGSDNLAELHLWHDFNWLKNNVRFLIIPRPGHPANPKLLKKIRRKTLKTVPSDISSTQIRQIIRQGGSIHGLVPAAIEKSVFQQYLPLLMP